MSSDLIEINGYSFELGFKWELPLYTGSSDVDKILDEHKSTSYIVLKSTSKTSSDVIGHKKAKSSKSKSYSLAAYVFDILKYSYDINNAAFVKMIDEDKFYLLLIEDGFIQTGTDVLVETLDEVRQFVQAANENGYKVVVDFDDDESFSDVDADSLINILSFF